MMRAYPHYLDLGSLLCCLVLVTSAVTRAEDAVLRHYIDLALAQNPRITAADFRADAAAERIPQAGALADPMLGFGLSEYPMSGPTPDRLRMATKRLSVEQQFPWPGTRAAERAMAGADHAMQSAMAAAERVMLALDVKLMYREWQRVRAELVLIDSNRTVLQQMLVQTQSGYAVGMGDISDVLRVQTELNEMDAMRADLLAMQKQAVADLNICCQLPPDAMTTPPLPLTFEPWEYLVDSVLARVETANPELRAAESKHEATRIGVRSARKMAMPMWSVGVEYMRRDVEVMESDGHTVNSSWEPDHMISVMGGITLPVYRKSKQNRLIAQRQLETMQAGDERDVVYNDLHLAVTKALADLSALGEQVALYEQSILPQARMTREAALAGFANGRVDFMALLSSEMSAFELERKQVARIADYAMARARLEAAMGEVDHEE